eukprot:jgi/Bigna1/136077/aug1.32_g10785
MTNRDAAKETRKICRDTTQNREKELHFVGFPRISGFPDFLGFRRNASAASCARPAAIRKHGANKKQHLEQVVQESVVKILILGPDAAMKWYGRSSLAI